MLSCIRLFVGLVLVLLCQVKGLRIPISSFKKMLIPSVAGAIVGFGNYMPAEATAQPAEIKCIVTIRQGDLLPAGDKVALYLTAREDVGILTAQIRNFKPPPVLSSRLTIEGKTFPIEVVLTAKTDLTPEGSQSLNAWQSGKNPLVISARLDTDGVAATRDPGDLVGRAIVKKVAGGDLWEAADIEVQGRGLVSKFITNPTQN